MDWLLIICGIVLILLGIAGSLLPLLPGPPIAYAGLLLQQLRDPNPFSSRFLLIWAVVVVIILLLDYLIPIWGTRRYGGTRYGMWGCTLGFLAAFWLGPWGVIIGPFAGAFLGEMLAKQDHRHAFRAAVGSFMGFLLGSLLKIVVCFLMLFYMVKSI